MSAARKSESVKSVPVRAKEPADPMVKVYRKLFDIQRQLKAPKNQFNSFGNYKYRSCEDILEAAKPHCISIGAVLQLSDDVQFIGQRHYVRATATLIDVETGASVSSTAYAREDETKKGMDGSQISGAASSYARKYALNGLLCIDDTRDSDAQAPSKTREADNPLDDVASNSELIALMNQIDACKNIDELNDFADKHQEMIRSLGKAERLRVRDRYAKRQQELR